MVLKVSFVLEVFDTVAAVLVFLIVNSEPHLGCTMANTFSALACKVF